MMALWRWLFAALLCATVGLAVYTAQNLSIDTDLADVSPQINTTPHTKAAIKSLTDSIEKRILLLVSGADEEVVFDAEDELRSSLSTLEGITVLPDSITLLEQVVEGLKPYRFSLLSEQQRLAAQQQSATQIARQAKDALYGLSGQAALYAFDEDPLGWHSQTIFDLLNSPTSGLGQANDGNALIGLTIDSDAMDMRTQRQLGLALDQAISQLQANHAVTVERSGVFFFAAHAAKAAKEDISLISTGSTIGVVVLLLFAFRSLRALLLPVVSIALGVVFAIVVTHTWFGKVHILTIVFGASLIGIVIDYSLHYLYHRSEHHQPKHSQHGTSSLHRALLLSLMTSLIGYAALSFSDLQALRKVAVFSCCGLFMAWLSVVCLGDLALRKPLNRARSLFANIVDAINAPLGWLSGKLWAGLAVLLIGMAAILLATNPNFSDDPRVFFTLSEQLLASERKVADAGNDYEPGRYIIINGANDTEVYQRHAALLDGVSNFSTLQKQDFTSLLAWVPNARTQAENYSVQSKLYAQSGAADQLAVALSGDSSAVESVKQAYREAEQRILKPDNIAEMLGQIMPPLWFRDDSQTQQMVSSFVLIRKGANTEQLSQLTAQLDGVEFINSIERTRDALSTQRSSASKLLMLAYLLVAGLILLRYRQLNALWLLAVPIAASAMLVLLSTAMGFGLNLFHIMALFLVLGFGMDYTIFVREMRHQHSITLQAIFLSAITSLLSFGLLSHSSIPVVASFGTTLLFGNLFNLLGAMIYAQSQTPKELSV